MAKDLVTYLQAESLSWALEEVGTASRLLDISRITRPHHF